MTLICDRCGKETEDLRTLSPNGIITFDEGYISQSRMYDTLLGSKSPLSATPHTTSTQPTPLSSTTPITGWGTGPGSSIYTPPREICKDCYKDKQAMDNLYLGMDTEAWKKVLEYADGIYKVRKMMEPE